MCTTKLVHTRRYLEFNKCPTSGSVLDDHGPVSVQHGSTIYCLSARRSQGERSLAALDSDDRSKVVGERESSRNHQSFHARAAAIALALVEREAAVDAPCQNCDESSRARSRSIATHAPLVVKALSVHCDDPVELFQLRFLQYVRAHTHNIEYHTLDTRH